MLSNLIETTTALQLILGNVLVKKLLEESRAELKNPLRQLLSSKQQNKLTYFQQPSRIYLNHDKQGSKARASKTSTQLLISNFGIQISTKTDIGQPN